MVRLSAQEPDGRRTSPLDDINITQWTDELTEEPPTLVASLERLVELEPRQEELLDEIVAGEQISVHDLEEAGVLPVPDDAKRPVVGVPVEVGGSADAG